MCNKGNTKGTDLMRKGIAAPLVALLIFSLTLALFGNTAFAATESESAGGYTLTLSARPEEGGTVSGAGTYPVGQNAVLKAEPAPGYTFAGWYRPDEDEPFSMESEFEFDLEVSRTYIARFDKAVAIAAIPEPAVGGTVTQNGDGNYLSEDVVSLTAIPNEGYSFIGWFDASSPAAAISTDAIYNFYATQSMSFIARFAAQYTVDANITPEEGGSVNGTGNHAGGSIVMLEAIPNEDYRFVGWAYPSDPDKIISREARYSLNLDANLTFNAKFSRSFQYIFSWIAAWAGIGAGAVIGILLLRRYIIKKHGDAPYSSMNDFDPPDDE